MASRIVGYFGLPGAGKTYAMTAAAIDWRRAHPDKPIYSTYEIRLPNVWALDPPGDPWGPTVPLLEAHDGLVLLDEVALILNARLYQKTPMRFLQMLMQHRKHRLEVWYTTQFPSYADSILRLLTVESYHMESFGRVPLLPFFWGSVHAGVAGKRTGFFWVLRTPLRDSVYDTEAVQGRAAYYGEELSNERVRRNDGGLSGAGVGVRGEAGRNGRLGAARVAGLGNSLQGGVELEGTAGT